LKKGFQIGEWTIQPQLNCVSRGTDVVHLEPKVMQVLVKLSEHPGDLVPKEELIRSVWPDSIVGDEVLIRCVYELRQVFNDNPRSPRVIQTISKQGYRLIADVTFPSNGSGAPPTATATAGRTPTELPPNSTQQVPAADPARTPRASWVTRKRWISVGAAILTVVIALTAIQVGRNAGSHAASFRTVLFTSYPGSAHQPVFSPDGNKIAFSWNGEDSGETWSLYVKQRIGSETPVRLTSAAADDLSPAWSPDGKWIAFTRRSQRGNGIYMMPAIGGPERKLYDLHSAVDPIEPGLTWSPNGKQLVFPDGKSEDSPSFLVSLSVDSLEAKPITHPNDSWDGDFTPAFSPDGKMIAFVRGSDLGNRRLYVMNSDGGEPKQLTTTEQQFHGISWTSDGSAIIFSSNAGGVVSLWRVPVSGGTAQRLPFGSDKAYTPAISPKGNILAYSQGAPTWSTMRVDLKSPRTPAIKLTSSKGHDFAPRFSHDGKNIVFQSWRSGTQEIWSSPSATTDLIQLTSFNGPMAGSPSWSPDDSLIAFDSRADGPSHIFVMNANGGAVRRVTSGEFTDILPDWSHDGRWIYFASKRSGKWQIWKTSIDSAQVQQVTTQGGFVAKESTDGNWVYYTKYDAPGLWRVPATGGNEMQILDSPPSGYWASFTLGPAGVYFLAMDEAHSSIAFYNFSRKKTTLVYTLAHQPAQHSSFTVSPDDRWLLYTDSLSRDGDIVLVENFR
jgi:Tol biopolymer transport system component/DNA-binding winged helix-turn-helix (wHTH) protein